MKYCLKEMKEKGVLAYLAENHFQQNAFITCPQFTDLEPGEAFVLLGQIPPDQRALVTKLELEYAGLGDHEGGDLSPIKKLFPNMKMISLGIGINVEHLGRLVEQFPDLLSLGLMALHTGVSLSGDDHLKRLIIAAQKGALQNLTNLVFAQNTFSPIVLDSLFKVLPKLDTLEFKNMILDPYVPKLISALRDGALSKLSAFHIYGRNLMPQNLGKLVSACTCVSVSLQNSLGDEESVEALMEAIGGGALKRLRYLNLSYNAGIQPRKLAEILGALLQLQEVELEMMNLINEHMIAILDRINDGRLQNVSSLNVGKNPKLSVKAVAAVAAGLPNLAKLSMVGMKLNGNSVKELAGKTSLTHIDLRESELSPEALKYFVEQKPALKSLDLFGTMLSYPHFNVLIQARKAGWLNSLESLNLGGNQLYTGSDLQQLAEALPNCLQLLYFERGVIVREHLEGLYQASKKGALIGIRNLYINICGKMRQVVYEDSGPLVRLVCNLPNLKCLDLYCVATDSLLRSLITKRNEGQLAQLNQINIMECYGIQPETLKMLHIAFPEQGLGYFEMGFKDEHAYALVDATKQNVKGVYPLQGATLFNATNNPFSADGLSRLLAHLPALKQLYLNGGDLSEDKLNAIVQVRCTGKLKNVTAVCMEGRGVRLFSPKALESFIYAFGNLNSFSLTRTVIANKDIRLLARAAESKGALQHVTYFAIQEGMGPEISYASLIQGEKDKKEEESEIFPLYVPPMCRVNPAILARLLSNLPLLSALYLNAWITNENIEALIPVVEQGKLCKLAKLDLSNNPMISNPKLLVALVKAVLKTSPGFHDLSLKRIGLVKEGWDLLLGELKGLSISQ